MRVFSDGIGGAAAVDDLFSLLEGGTEGTAPVQTATQRWLDLTQLTPPVNSNPLNPQGGHNPVFFCGVFLRFF